MTTAFILRKEFWKHDTGLYHPENSQRLTAIQERLESTSYFSKLNRLQGREATEEDLKLIHDSDYVSKALKRLSLGSGSFDADTPYSEGSYSAALLAAGAGLELADAILEGKAQNGFALVRPPGHHAETNRAMGFCFFNNVAITARYLQKSLKKIFIIDWDVHHGNGTQSSFYEDDTVFFFSSHQYPFYPGTGSFQEIGLGKGKDFTKNHPLQRGSGEDKILEIFSESLLKEIEKFQPEFILISAGFDAHKKDPLGGLEFSTSTFEKMTILVKKAAEEFCKGRIISFLEGGYDVSALSESVEAHLAVLNS